MNIFNKYKIFSETPLGMNLRNYLILASNPIASMFLAKDKIAAKEALAKKGILSSETIMLIKSRSELGMLKNLPTDFVIKPSKGSGGGGILVLKKNKEKFIDPSGEEYSLKKLTNHCQKILDGEYAGGAESDVVMIEQKLVPSKAIIFDQAAGLPDIRVFCVRHKPVMAMMRYATRQTKGRANLSAGAYGIALNIENGAIMHIHKKKHSASIFPEDLGIPQDFKIPKWAEILEVSSKASEISGLLISGIDIILDEDDRVRVLEVNGRPGIEIQNINEKSLLKYMNILDKNLNF